ncbi:MAG: hypothetical protein OHK0039_25730 [Bacteroidia bacterium]
MQQAPILYYALGGGLGHLTRAMAFADMQGWTDVHILTSHPMAAQVVPSHRLVQVPRESIDPLIYAPWLQHWWAAQSYQDIYIDAFPSGIVGELSRLPGIQDRRLWHLARRLQFGNYAPLIGEKPLHYHEVLQLEALEKPHAQWLRRHSDHIRPFTIDYPTPALPPDVQAAWEAIPGPRWLVVHAGSSEETATLLRHTQRRAKQWARKTRVSPTILLSSTLQASLTASVQRFDHYPAAALFPLADYLVTACGFNTMMQTLPYRDKHLFIPFYRRYDDQFARAKAHRAQYRKLLRDH